MAPSLENLPLELMDEILARVDYFSLVLNVRLVSKFFHSLVQDPQGDALRNTLFFHWPVTSFDEDEWDSMDCRSAAKGYHVGKPYKPADPKDEEYYCFLIHPGIKKIRVPLDDLERKNKWNPFVAPQISGDDPFSLPIPAKEFFKSGQGRSGRPFLMWKGRLDGYFDLESFANDAFSWHVRDVQVLQMHHRKSLVDKYNQVTLIDVLKHLCRKKMKPDGDAGQTYGCFEIGLFDDYDRTNTKQGGKKWSLLPDPHYRDPKIVCLYEEMALWESSSCFDYDSDDDDSSSQAYSDDVSEKVGTWTEELYGGGEVDSEELGEAGKKES